MGWLVTYSAFVHDNIRMALGCVVAVFVAVWLLAIATTGTYIDLRKGSKTDIATAVGQVTAHPLFSSDNPIRKVPKKVTLWEMAGESLAAKWMTIMAVSAAAGFFGADALRWALTLWLVGSASVARQALGTHYHMAKSGIWLWDGSELTMGNVYVTMEQMGIGKLGAKDTPIRTVGLVLAYKSAVGYKNLPQELKAYLKTYSQLTLAYLAFVRIENK